MSSKHSPKELLAICDLNLVVDDSDGVTLNININSLTDVQILGKKAVFKFREKTLSIPLNSKSLDPEVVLNGGSLVKNCLEEYVCCLSDVIDCPDGISKKYRMKHKWKLFLNFLQGGNLNESSFKTVDLADVIKTISSLTTKGKYFNDLDSTLKTSYKTIYGPPCNARKFTFHFLSPTFYKLIVSGIDKWSPSPERLPNSRNVKRFVPRDQDGTKLIQTPRSLMFAVLGWSGNAPTVTIEAYDPLVRKWFYVSQDGFIKRAYHGVVMLGILIYVIGGFDGRMCFNSVFCFDIQSRRWYRRSSLHVPRCYVSAVALRGLVYALGGFDGDERFRSCERFDPRTRQWRYFASMNERRSDASAAVHKGKIFICGGFNGTQVLTSTEMYDQDHDQWTLVSNMLSPRSGHVLASYGNVMFAIGGYDGEKRLRTVEQYDDVKEKWIKIVPMLSPRSNFAAAVLENKLHVIGGYNGHNTCLKVERYDDVTKEWQSVRSLNKHRSALGACVFNDSMIVSMCSVTGHITIRTVNMEQPSP